MYFKLGLNLIFLTLESEAIVSISEKTKVSMLADVDDAHINITENQEKVIRSKYIKDDPNVEIWLRRVVRNIALAELIYHPKFHKKIFEGVKHTLEKIDTGDGKFSNLCLIHKDMSEYNERTQNFNKFMSNLYELVAEDEKAHSIVNETEKKFYDMLSKWKFLPNSPTLMNAGRRLQQLSACYVLPIEDSIEGWMKAATDAAIIHKTGGGTGFAASRVRSSGAMVGSTRGIATGPMSPFMIINATTEQIKQGGQRRGANMGILSVYHPNIREFIEFKKPQGQLENFNISVALDENFMNKVEQDGEIELVDPHSKEIMAREKAKDIFDLMVKCAWETGDPGFVFIDRINASGSNPTPALGEIESTNPCVAEGTLVNTPFGYKKVEDLKQGDKISTVFGSEPINAIEVHETIPVFNVKFSDGGEQIVTAAHRYFAVKKGSQSKKVQDVRLDELEVGDYVRVEPTPVMISEPEKYAQGLRKGILLGDGCYTQDCYDKNIVKIATSIDDAKYNENVKELFRDWNFRKDDVSNNSKSVNMLISNGRDLMQTVGLTQAYSYQKTFDIEQITSVEEAVGILDGLLATDGDILLKSNHPQIRFTTSSKELAQNIRRLLLMIGCHGRIFSEFRDDGGIINGRKIVRKHTKHTVVVSGASADKLAKLSKLEKINPIKGKKLRELTKEWLTTGNTWKAKIISIEPAGTAKVFDLYCEKSDTWITDGYVQRGCGEQPLLPYEPCNLGSINLSKFVRPDGSDMDWNALAEIVDLTTHFLDNVIEVNNYPLPEIERIAKGNRRIGLGVMGWAETLVMLGIPYDSEAAIKKAEQVMEFVNKNCLKASEKLAEARGVFPNFKDSIFDENGKYFRIRAFPRNCARTTIAPTGTIAICAALQGSGIEPFFSIAYIRYNAQGIDQLKEGKTPSDEHTFFEYNKLFGEVAKKNNFFGLKEKELWKKISENHGSVRGIKEIPEHIQKVFCSSYDVTTEYHIMQQAAFQRHTDNAVSKTINMPNSATIEDVWNAYFFAYKQGVKGVTIYRDGSKSFQVLSNTNQVKTETKTADDNLKKKFIAATVRSRPEEVSGTTYKIKTGYGSLFVTVNNDEDGAPFEIFATTGKTGGVLAAKAEAICRLISLNLRAGISADEIIEQLKGIRGPMPTWSKYGVVFSIPDAIAKILAVHINRGQTSLEQFAGEEKQTALPISKQATENTKKQPLAIADVGEIPECPDCRNILQFGEGCAVCHFCGYSKCS